MFDVRRTPFSRCGSYLAVHASAAHPGEGSRLTLHSLRGQRPGQEVFLLGSDTEVATKLSARPELLALTFGPAAVQVCMPDAITTRLRAVGGVLTLARTSIGTEIALPLDDRTVEVCLSNGWKYRVTALSGSLQVDAPWNGVDRTVHIGLRVQPDHHTNCAELVVEEYQSHRPAVRHHDHFENVVSTVRAEFGRWLDSTPSVPAAFADARELCAYVCWSSLVDPSGHHQRPTMYMSKDWMHGVWSWDHCFNSLALATTQPDLAWHQYMTVFDHIHSGGALPDNLTDTTLDWSYCKPPIHGWALRWLQRNSDVLTPARVTEIYPLLARWTTWWFTDRDDNGDGIPQYNHGNESGWDNATAFAAGVPVDSPDLTAFLIVQLETLANLAERLSLYDEARQWMERADLLVDHMVRYFAEGDDLVARHTHTGQPIRHLSLLGVIPLVIGHRLPERVQARLLEQLVRHVTVHGLATETPDSAAYEHDGYWRGPIWAPSTFLLVEALRDLGEQALANQISRNFCDLVRDGGPAENFDALNGQPLRDPAFTWTASVFLLLAHGLLDEPTPDPGKHIVSVELPNTVA